MLEPQGTVFFLILMAVFAGLLAWLIFARHLVFRVLAACLAFIPAMLFGVAAVNKYYDYYQTWGSIASDFTNQGVATLPEVPHLAGKAGGGGISKLGLSPQARAEATQTGYLFGTLVKGRESRMARTVYIYLPPQYFLTKYNTYRFPVIEMLHGSPGNPEQWVNPMNILPTLDDMIASHQADPAVLVMPDTDGSEKYSLQCLNAVGVQDATYVAVDVPAFVAANYRVQPPGRAWGLAGLSEGGYCAANLALQYPDRFGYAGVISGYFAPLDDLVPPRNRPGTAPVYVNPFAGDPKLRQRNTPSTYITRLPVGTLIPQFFLAAGQQDGLDVQAAESFRQEAQLYQANVPLVVIPNASHDATAWRGALRPMFSWMTPQLAHQAQLADTALAARERAQARAKASKHPQGAPSPTSTVPPVRRGK